MFGRYRREASVADCHRERRKWVGERAFAWRLRTRPGDRAANGRQRLNIDGAIRLETNQTKMIEAEAIDAPFSDQAPRWRRGALFDHGACLDNARERG